MQWSILNLLLLLLAPLFASATEYEPYYPPPAYPVCKTETSYYTYSTINYETYTVETETVYETKTYVTSPYSYVTTVSSPFYSTEPIVYTTCESPSPTYYPPPPPTTSVYETTSSSSSYYVPPPTSVYYPPSSTPVYYPPTSTAYYRNRLARRAV